MTASPAHAVSAYRPDIDGLRAFAVTAVIGFHAGLGAFAGGYIGVDVFFVISGYLITRIIDREIDDGRFSLLKFYERRVRRIFPALLVMLLAVWLFGAASLYPTEMKTLNESLIATILSVSNIYFYTSINYFHPGDGMALLHTWSLSVEEQFYVLFPLMLLALKHWLPRLMMPILMALFVVSLVASAIGVYQFPSATFYLLPTRAWELMVGCLLALWTPSFQLSRMMREALALIGALLLGVSMAMLDSKMPFPGLLAVAPCIGAGLIIFAGNGGTTLVTKALSWRPVVFVGLISYSLYLWHLPVMAFLDNESLLFHLALPLKVTRIAMLVVIAALGYLSWRFVEKPFRNQTNWPMARIFRAAGTASAALFGLGCLTLSLNGQVNPTQDPRSLHAASYLAYPAEAGFRKGTCFLMPDHSLADFDDAQCLTPQPDRSNVLLVGDSFAAHLYTGLDQSMRDTHVLQATFGACQPLKGHIRDAKCAAFYDKALSFAATNPDIDYVVLAGRWSRPQLAGLSDTLAWLRDRGVRVLLVGSPPTYKLALPRLLALSYRDGVDLIPKALEDGAFDLDHSLAELAAQHGADYMSLLSEYCDGKTCHVQTPTGQPMAYDDGHFTQEGSILAGQKIAEHLRQGLNPSRP
jgi:peptidoglycan/LPS O-acetylase OafA/YrhL